MKNSLQRIKEFIDFKGLTISSFEKIVGFSNGSFASQLKKNKTIGVDKLEKILIVFMELNPEWILTGKGKMIKNEKKLDLKNDLTENNTEFKNNLNSELEAKNKVIEVQTEIIESLKRENLLLRELLEVKKNQ